MKQPKRLTREQKICADAQGLNVDEWGFVEETEFYYKLINKKTGLIKYVDKFIKKRR